MALISKSFKNETTTSSSIVEPVIVVADLIDDKYSVLDIYSTSSYLFKDQDGNNIKQSKDIISKVSSVKSSVDYETKKTKTNTFRFSIYNYFDINKKLTNSEDYTLSDGTSLNSMIGKHIILYYKTLSSENLYLLKETNSFMDYDSEIDLCSIMFLGIINRVTQKKDMITIQSEDYSQDYIKDKELPINNVSTLPEEIINNLIETDLEKPIPMVFGKVEHASTISYKTNIPNTQGFISLGFIHDSFPISSFDNYLTKSGETLQYHLFLKDDDDYVCVPYTAGKQPNNAKSYFIDIVDTEQSAYIVPELHNEALEKESIYAIGIIPSSTFIGNPHTNTVGALDSLTGIVSDIENLNYTEAITREYNKKNMWNGPNLPELENTFETEMTYISPLDYHSQWYLIGLKRDILITKLYGGISMVSTPANSVPFSLYGKPFSPEQFKLLFQHISSSQYLDYILNDATIYSNVFPKYKNATLTLPENIEAQQFPSTLVGVESLGPSAGEFYHHKTKERYEESEKVNQFLLFDYANNTESVTVKYSMSDIMFQYIKKIEDYGNETFYSAIEGRKDYFSTEPINNLEELETSFDITLEEGILGDDGVLPNFEEVVDEWDNYFASMYEHFPSDEIFDGNSGGSYYGDVILGSYKERVDTMLWGALLFYHMSDSSVYDFGIKQGNFAYNYKTTCDSDDATFLSSPKVIESILHGCMKKMYINIWQLFCYEPSSYRTHFSAAFYHDNGYYYPVAWYNINEMVGYTYYSNIAGTPSMEHRISMRYAAWIATGQGDLELWGEFRDRTEEIMRAFGQHKKWLLRRIFKYLYQNDLNEDHETDMLVTNCGYEWNSFDIDLTSEEGLENYLENLGVYLDDTMEQLNKSIYDRGSRRTGTMSYEDFYSLFPSYFDENLRVGHRNELYVWNDSPENITLEHPPFVRLYNYISLDSIRSECFSIFALENNFQTSGVIEKPTDIFMNILFRELNYGYKDERVDSSAFDSLQIEKSRNIYSNWKMGFCIDDKVSATSLLDNFCQETKSVFNFNAEGKVSIITIDNDYVYEDIDHIIDKDDVTNFLITRTKREKIITSNKFYYKYDNGQDRYKGETLVLKAEDLYDGYNGYEYYNIKPDLTLQEKELRYHVDGGTVDDFLKFDLGHKINQHLLIDLELPLTYSNINIGSILHIPLLEDDKAFGIDYSILQTLNGQTILPIWIVTGIDITLDRIIVKAMQLHHIKKTVNDVTSFMLPDAVNVLSINTKLYNTLYEMPNGDPILNWNYVNPNYISPNVEVMDSGIEIPYGDVNGDGQISIYDLVGGICLEILEGGGVLSQVEKERADVNQDGRLDVVDAVLIFEIIMHN